MKELYGTAIQKMKRKDFLDDIIREKTVEESNITQEVAVLRKKNGRQTGTDYDLRIYQLNMRKASISKLIAKCKVEIKNLKQEILDILVECYAKADLPENRQKVKSALNHAFGGKMELLTAEDVGGIWGDCEIVGAVTTQDKKRKNTIAKTVKAGARNFNGRLVKKPQIVVYDYDKKKPSGEYRAENDAFKEQLKKKKTPRFIRYVSETYGNENTVFACFLALLYAVFTISAGVIGFLEGMTSFAHLRYGVAIPLLLGTFTLLTLKTGKRGGVCDFLPFASILIGIIGLVSSLVWFKNIFRGLIFPVALLSYGVVAIILRAILGEEREGEEEKLNVIAILFAGVILAFIFKMISNTHTVYWGFFVGVVGVFVLITTILAFANLKSEKDEKYWYGSLLGFIFSLTCVLLAPNQIWTAIFLLASVIFGLSAVVTKSKRKENV